MAEFRNWRVEFDESTSKHLPAPPGCDPGAARELASRSTTARGGEVDSPALRRAKQEAVLGKATGAFKSVTFLCFMMWMSGSQLHIFSIMSTMSGVYQPLSAILTSGKLFHEDDKGLETRKPQVLFCVIQACGLAYALYKLNGMGLLPTHLSDFASYFTAPQPLEFSSGVVL